MLFPEDGPNIARDRAIAKGLVDVQVWRLPITEDVRKKFSFPKQVPIIDIVNKVKEEWIRELHIVISECVFNDDEMVAVVGKTDTGIGVNDGS